MPIQIGNDENGNPVYAELHSQLAGESLHDPKPPVIETFTVNPNESVLTLTGTIGNYALVRVRWNGVLQSYPVDYVLSEAQVTLLFNRLLPAQISVEYYP